MAEYLRLTPAKGMPTLICGKFMEINHYFINLN
jgi:hypothetical protein